MNPHEENKAYATELFQQKFGKIKIHLEIEPIITHTVFRVYDIKKLYGGRLIKDLIGYINITNQTFNPIGTDKHIPLD